MTKAAGVSERGISLEHVSTGPVRHERRERAHNPHRVAMMAMNVYDTRCMHTKIEPRLLAAVTALMAAGFLFDINTPVGVSDWIIYLAPIVLSARSGPLWLPLAAAAVCSVLTPLGFWFSPPGVSVRIAVVNRVMAFAAIWITAFASRRNRAYKEALLASAQELRRAEHLKTVGSIAAGLAHGLGTPLNVIDGRIQFILADASAGDGVRRNAAIIQEQTERIARIVQQLLDFSRSRTTDLAPVDLRDVVDGSTELLRPLAEKQGIALQASMPAGSVPVCVDVTQIQEVLANLVMNAVQAMPNGGHVTVDVRQGAADVSGGPGGATREWASVSVVDQGEGIDERNLKSLFEPFFTTKGRDQGTGLGLSIAREIISNHGGWIDAHSEKGVGSRFTVYLPLER